MASSLHAQSSWGGLGVEERWILVSRSPIGAEIIFQKSSAFPRAVPGFFGASPHEHLHPQLAFGPGAEPALPCSVSLFWHSLASPLALLPLFVLRGGHQISSPFSHPLPNHFLEAWHFIQGRLGQGGCKKKKKKIKIGAVSSSWSAALATSLSFPLAA